MRIKRTLCSLGLAAALALSSCSQRDVIDIGRGISISFSWWGKDVRHSYTISALKDFVVQNPEIDVMPEYSEFEAFQKRMNVVYAAHNECDVMQINYDWLYRYSPDGNGFYDMNELSKYIDLSNFTEEQLSYGKINGKLNGISNALNTETCYYNKDIYDKYGLELPKTWDDLFKAAEVMRGDGVYPIELSKKASWMMSIAYEEQKTGIQCFNERGQLCFTPSNFSDMIDFYQKLLDEKVCKYYKDINKNDFLNGVTAGSVCWISDAGYYCEPVAEAGNNIVVGDYLRSEGSAISGWYAKPTSLYCIKRDTPYPEACAKLVNFLVNGQEMAQKQGIEKGIPLSKAMLEVLEANDQLKGIQNVANEKLAASDSITRISPLLENSGLVEVFEEAVKQVIFEEQDISEYAKKLHDAALNLTGKPAAY